MASGPQTPEDFRNRGRAMDAATRRDAGPSGIRFLLMLKIGAGPLYRFSDQPVAVQNLDGSWSRYAGGLIPPNVAWSAEDSTGGGPRSVRIAIRSSEDWNKLDRNGTDLEGAKAILLEWAEGSVLDKAQPVIRGFVADPVYGDPDDPQLLAFTLEDIPWEDVTPIQDPTKLVNGQTFPAQAGYGDFGDQGAPATGAMWPIPIGYPGLVALEDGEAISPGAPAYLVEFRADLASATGHRVMVADRDIHASTVVLHDVSEGTQSTVNVMDLQDALGRDYSGAEPEGDYTSLYGRATVNMDPTHAYYTEFTQAGGGGIWNKGRTGPLRGAGEVLIWALEQTDLPLDKGRMEVARDVLDAFQIDTVIMEPQNILAWVRDALLPILPVAAVEGPRGWYFMPWRFDAKEQDATFHLNLDSDDGSRVSPIGRTHAYRDVINRVVLNYAPRRDTGVYLRREVITGFKAATDPDWVSESYRCAFSQTRYGQRTESWSTDAVYDPATAQLVAQWLAWKWSLPRRTFVVDAPGNGVAGTIQPGAVGTFTEAAGYLSRDVGLVRSVTHRGGRVGLIIELQPRPQALAKTGA